MAKETPTSHATSRLVELCLLLLTVLVSTFGFACAKRDTGKPVVTLVAALLPSEQTPYTRLLESFTDTTGIRVRLVAQQYAEIRTAIQAEARAGRGELDLVELDVYMLPLLQPLMRPLDSLLWNADDLRSHATKSAWEAGTFGKTKRTFFVPHRLNWQALFYDTKSVPRPPATWGELLAVARKHPGGIGLKAARYEGLVCDLFPFVWQAGGDILKPSSPAAVQAMRFLQQLRPFLNTAAASYKENSILQAQEHREVVLHPNWPFAVPLLRQKGLLGRRIKTAPLPRGPVRRATILGGGYLGIPKTAPHPKAAARLLSYLTSAEVQKGLVAALGWFPIRSEAWQAMSEQDRRDFSGFLAMKDAVFARPNVPFYPQVSQIWQDGFYRIVFRGENPAVVLKEMQARVDALVAAAGR